jgi:hypothetical protein
VLFAEVFHLQHFRSKKFLSVNWEAGSDSQSDRSTLLILTKHPLASTHFTFLPAFRYQPEKSKYVRYNEMILFASGNDKGQHVQFSANFYQAHGLFDASTSSQQQSLS